MQDPNEDTEWNDILRAKGILPAKEPEVTEEALTEMIEQTIQQKQSIEYKLSNMTNEELEEQEDDDENEAIILEFRRRRLEELKKENQLSKFGDVLEISGVDYVEQVNNAGEGIWVYLHLYKPGIPLCSLINQHFSSLAKKYPKSKFIKSISTTCIPNFPDKNLPAIFVYFEGKAKEQIIGEFSEKLSCDALEWRLSRGGGIKTDLEEDPAKGKKAKDVLMSEMGGIRQGGREGTRRDSDSEDSDEDDW